MSTFSKVRGKVPKSSTFVSRKFVKLQIRHQKSKSNVRRLDLYSTFFFYPFPSSNALWWLIKYTWILRQNHQQFPVILDKLIMIDTEARITNASPPSYSGSLSFKLTNQSHFKIIFQWPSMYTLYRIIYC